MSGTLRSVAMRLDAPLDRSRRRLKRDSVVALVYHRVGLRTLSPVDIGLEAFRDQLDWLRATCTPLTLDEALDHAAGSVLPARPVVTLTFDDGTGHWVDVVLPDLVCRGIPACFYVSTDFVERGRPFPHDGAPVSWRGLDEMVSTGLVEVGSHTHTHQVLAHSGGDEARREVDTSIGLIEDRLGRPCRHFAYPKAVAPSPAAEVVVRRRFATAALAGNQPITASSDPHRLGRHALNRRDDSASFARKALGGMRLEGWVRERRDAWRVSREPRQPSD